MHKADIAFFVPLEREALMSWSEWKAVFSWSLTSWVSVMVSQQACPPPPPPTPLPPLPLSLPLNGQDFPLIVIKTYFVACKKKRNTLSMHTENNVGDAKKNTARTSRRAKGGRRKHRAMSPPACYMCHCAMFPPACCLEGSSGDAGQHSCRHQHQAVEVWLVFELEGYGKLGPCEKCLDIYRLSITTSEEMKTIV